jgi:hypothetical protein
MRSHPEQSERGPFASDQPSPFATGHARQRFPTKSESERIQALLDEFDRRR